MAVLLQVGSTAVTPLVASLDEQESRRLSFLPTALIFLLVHLSALAVPAPSATMAKASSASAATGIVCLVIGASTSRNLILRPRADRQAKRCVGSAFRPWSIHAG